MTTTTHGPPRGLEAARQLRREVISERTRCQYLLRLVQAELDLLVARAAGGADSLTLTGAAPIPAPRMPDLAVLISHDCDDLVSRIVRLHLVQRQLLAYEAELTGVCQSATSDMVAGLRRDPRSCLSAQSADR